MTVYAIRRIIILVPLLWAVATMTFFLMHAVPGGPFDAGDKALPPAVRAALNAKYDLDEPLPSQYLAFLRDLSRGDLGISFQRSRPVADVLGDGLPATVELGVTAFVFALVSGLTLGMVSAVKQNTIVDYLAVLFATAGAAVPSFVVAILLVVVFSLELGWFDVIGWEFGNPQKMVLPAVSLGVFPAAFIARITRAAMLETLRADYIRTARAKGLKELRVVVVHAARNALIPVLTVAGPIFAVLITGSFIIERAFAIAGVGGAYVDAVFARDYGVIMGTTLLFAAAIAVINLLVDLAYAVADPRVRYS